MGLKDFKIAGYVRISRDEDKSNYGTIISQRDMITNYALDNHDSEVTEFYEDDNVSGYSLIRPSFGRLVKDIDDKKINVVIAKDLSRIGRHNAHVLLLVEELKSKGVKLICIDDNFDSDKDEDGMLGIKTWFNERYIKDISKKIKSNIKTQMRKGDYNAAIPFGYSRDPLTKKIIVRKENEEIIKKIFSLYLNGDGCRAIGKKLDESGMKTPSMQVREDRSEQGKTYKKPVAQFWDASMIHRILTNDFYTGKVRFGRFKTTAINGKSEKTEESEQIIFENNHEALISFDEFELTQNLLEKRKERNYRGNSGGKNLYSGFLKCKSCDSSMVALNKEGKNKSYICGRYNQLGKRCGCGTHYILDAKITLAIKRNLTIIKSTLEDVLLSLDQNVEDKIKKKDNFDASINRMEKDSMQIYDELKVTITQKIKEITKNPDMSDMINQMYEEIENEKRKKI